jgi:hypothetical protein
MQKARRHHASMTPTACRRTVSGTISLPCLGYFSPFPYGTGSLSGWCRQIQAGFLRSRLTQDTARPQSFTFTRLSRSMAQLSRRFYLRLNSKCSPTTLRQHAARVWAIPFSLATTWGIIIIFFSSSYLDVSVRRVGFHCWIMHLQCIRLSHSEIYGYNACVQLPVAYRSLPRPSSPLRAKAFTIRPYLL